MIHRAPHLKEFIKFGRSYAVLEIELCHPKGDVTIKRTIHANRSEWKINGEASNQETVVETVANMNIQVDNAQNKTVSIKSHVAISVRNYFLEAYPS